jgi:Ca2+-dependent lipid-binding protein
MIGIFTFKPIEAKLTDERDVLRQTDPYCAFMFSRKKVISQVCTTGGKHPTWSDSIVVPLEIDQPACVVELLDKEKTLPDDSIGTFVIDLYEIRRRGHIDKWYQVYYKDQPAGWIHIESKFQHFQDSDAEKEAGASMKAKDIIKAPVVLEEFNKSSAGCGAVKEPVRN